MNSNINNSYGSLSQLLISKFQSMSESIFTSSVVLPLLNSLGFNRVEIHGGPYEYGKDIICWRKDEFGQAELGVIQIKKYKSKVPSSDTKAFAGIVNQLQQAAENKIPNVDGHDYYPAFILFITPFPIDARSLQSRFEGYTSLTRRRVKIVDGPMVAELTLKHIPNVANEIIGGDPLIQNIISSDLNNIDLLKALNTKLEIDIASYWCDIDFSVGQITTRLFFSILLSPVSIIRSFNYEDWRKVAKCCYIADSFFGAKILNISYEEIEQLFQKNKNLTSLMDTNINNIINGSLSDSIRDFKNIYYRIDKSLLSFDEIINDNKIKTAEESTKLNGTIDNISSQFEHFRKEIEKRGEIEQDCITYIKHILANFEDILYYEARNDKFAKLSTNNYMGILKDQFIKHDDLAKYDFVKPRLEIEKHKNYYSNFESTQNQIIFSSLNDIYDKASQELIEVAKIVAALKSYDIRKEKHQIIRLLENIDHPKIKLSEKDKLLRNAKEFFKQAEKISALQVRIDNFLKQKPLPNVSITFEGENLSRIFIEKQHWLKETIRDLNKKKPSNKVLKDFLIECNSLFSSTEEILNNNHILAISGLNKKQKYVKIGNNLRLHISILEVFDSGINIALSGEAGAGKTTAMQMYAKKEIEKNDNSKLVLYLPLTRVILEKDGEQLLPKKQDPATTLEYHIIHYLRARGVNLSEYDLLNLLKSKKVVFLLDGIDEILGRAPWIIKAINVLPQHFPKSQVIASSRMNEIFLRNIKFLGITLLPFSNEQRELFIRGWFEKNDKQKIQLILKHIKQYPEVGEVIRSPLLATILCVLAEYDVPLPDKEVRIYDERMRLLLGQYDIQKKTHRLHAPYYLLEAVSKKLAIGLHSSGSRQKSLDILTDMACNDLSNVFEKDKIACAVRELIDPCNILVPMTDDGQFGFGHLRYQEYLVACELNSNRGIDICHLLAKSWWRGSLILFSQMCDNIEFILPLVDKYENFTRLEDVLKAMFSVHRDKKKLLEALTTHVEIEVGHEGNYESEPDERDWE